MSNDQMIHELERAIRVVEQGNTLYAMVLIREVINTIKQEDEKFTERRGLPIDKDL